jgi:hypothetical protein
MSKSEDLERKARFFCLALRAKKCAKNSGVGVHVLLFYLYALLIQGSLFW